VDAEVNNVDALSIIVDASEISSAPIIVDAAPTKVDAVPINMGTNEIKSASVTFRSLIDVPKSQQSSLAGRRKRKVSHAELVTSSPFKAKLQKIQEEKISRR
jgi:hypothetical protein